ncbi:1,5-anhydro-D-fructose reductase-like [Diabrotica virgifera virgifera]|nr:1,5-anhydro-D-fructose reductase-like [Diabrotica virgifera virgifera]
MLAFEMLVRHFSRLWPQVERQSLSQKMGKPMRTIPCGRLQMPMVGLGTWQANDPKEFEAALNQALDIGYRHIDTAAFYDNEHIIGKIINQWICSEKLKRDDLFIVTKLPIQGIHRDRVEKYLCQSLEKLCLDCLDLYLIHFPYGKTESTKEVVYEKADHKGIWQAMEKQVEAGRTKTIGISNFSISQIDNILKFCKIKPANLQIENHVFLQQPELVQFCHQNGIGVTAYSPLGSPHFNTFLKHLGLKERNLVNVLTNPVVAEIAKKHCKSNAQVALRFLIQRNLAVIPKSTTPERLKSNFDLFDFCLSDQEMKKLETLDIGEEARICDWKFFPKIEEHPAYPFRKNKKC